MGHELGTATIAVLAGTLSVLLAILAIRVFDRRNARRGTPRAVAGDLEPQLQPIVFLFQGKVLVDATDPAKLLLDGVSGSQDCWTRLLGWLAPRFPGAVTSLDQGLEDRLDVSGDIGTGSSRLRLVAEPVAGGLTRVTLTDPTAEHAGIMVDALTQNAIEEELDLLRHALDSTPMLAWRQDAEGRITWANSAYMRSAESSGEARPAWPLPRLFDMASGSMSRRIQLEVAGASHWYDCQGHRSGDQTMMHALPADAAVRAERALREFVQTLTKTFADLPIGLAIFDRERKLQLFNPALIDLTGLPTGFLTARPTLFDLLDRLRETRMVPEPRDYRSWRQQMANLEAAAATGHHVETWSLPGGQTYRVTGRPHPDGAVAFLFEDITSEISLTRKFKAELMLGNHVLDALDEALAVFAANGKLVLSNSAYQRLWGDGADNLGDAIRLWETRSEAGAGFEALRERLLTRDGAGRDNGAMAAPDGGLMGWTVRNLSGGRQIVRFQTAHVPAIAGKPEAAQPVRGGVANKTAPAAVAAGMK